MKDIADLAGVSIATRFPGHQQPGPGEAGNQGKVQKILEQTNFVANAVARGLVINSMRTIGVLTVDIRDMFSPGHLYYRTRL